MAVNYKDSGVDVEEGYNAVNEYKVHAKRTRIPGLLTDLGSFNGMFEIPKGIQNPVMVSGTDGVGTKLEIAFQLKKYDTVGIDCVAMSVNDILCSGVQTSFFLDYVACGKLDAKVAGQLVKGIADGCVDTGCALLGGETAEMPGFYDEGKYEAMKKMHRAVVINYCEYVRQRLKEHLANPTSINALSEETCVAILERLDRELAALDQMEIPRVPVGSGRNNTSLISNDNNEFAA